MIVVVGEALVDLVISTDVTVHAALGGAPYNTARAAARLGAPVRFVGGLSDDRFGRALERRLVDDGVDVDHVVRSSHPTTLAAAEIDERGAADYRFYLSATSAPMVTAADVARALPAPGRASEGPDVLFTGGLALVLDPMGDAVVEAVHGLAPSTVLVIDVNCRPAVIEDRQAYAERVRAVVARADVVKVSDEDLAYLDPLLPPLDAARRLVEGGARVVVVTAGSSGTTILDAAGTTVVEVPPVPRIVDTIGAGDTFGAGVLAWFTASGCGRDEVTTETVARAVVVGHAAAAVVVARRGADPPMRSELAIDWPGRPA